MENLIKHLYTKHINSKDPNLQFISRQEPIKICNLNQEQIQFYNTMFIRNFFTYSASLMEIRLSFRHLFCFLRLHKFQDIAKTAKIEDFFNQWIQNQMMPFVVPQGKKIPNGNPFIFVDFQDEQPKAENKPAIAEKPKSKSKGKKVQEEPMAQRKLSSHSNTVNTKIIGMLNVVELNNNLINMILAEQLKIEINELKNNDLRNQYIQKFKIIKIEQYISQRFGMDTLMTFNFIRVYPFIEEKDLLNRTMLSAVALRKCIASLVSDGIINFYPEGNKVMMYRTISIDRLKQKYTDHIAKSILNILIVLGQQQKDAEKTQIFLQSISTLDDTLNIFMS